MCFTLPHSCSHRVQVYLNAPKVDACVAWRCDAVGRCVVTFPFACKLCHVPSIHPSSFVCPFVRCRHVSTSGKETVRPFWCFIPELLQHSQQNVAAAAATAGSSGPHGPLGQRSERPTPRASRGQPRHPRGFPDESTSHHRAHWLTAHKNLRHRSTNAFQG